MEQFGYPDIDEHKELISFIDELKKIVIDGYLGQEDATKLNMKLSQWYIKHVGTLDRKLGSFFTQ